MFKIVMPPTCREDCVQHFVSILVCLLTNNFVTKKSTITTESQPLPVEKKTHVYLAYNVLTMIAIYVLGPAKTLEITVEIVKVENSPGI